jgi:hypothetical protein
MALEDGVSLIGECVSNQFLDDHHKFTPGQLGALKLIGWNAPSLPEEPNWYYEANSNAELVTLDEITHRTLKEIFGLQDRDVVEVIFHELEVGTSEGSRLQDTYA